ncbi:MAG: ACT domain-containing protein [Pseudomonadota bacterium]
MRVEQISVFLENKAGRLAEVAGILSEAGVNIRALSVADTSDFGILRLIVNDNQKAKETLRTHGFTVGKTNVLAVEVPDQPGGLHRILSILNTADVNVEYMYAFVHQCGDNAVMIFRFEKIDEAEKVLSENGVTVIDGNTLYAL